MMSRRADQAAFVCPDSGTHDDQRQRGDRGVGEDPLGVTLRHGDERSKEERNGADAGNADPGRAAVQDRGDLEKEIDAGLHHRARMEERRDRCGRHHGAGKPWRKGHLRRLHEPREGQQHRRDHHLGRARLDHPVEIEDARARGEISHASRKGDAPEDVHPERAESRVLRLLVIAIADEEERTERRYLPEEEHPFEAVRKDKAEHGRDETGI